VIRRMVLRPLWIRSFPA